ncbi:MAG: hypothetical protein [Enterobacter phage ENC31]|nr:MAG: hypothetical protein [Enterobacter phage ENC31]
MPSGLTSLLRMTFSMMTAADSAEINRERSLTAFSSVLSMVNATLGREVEDLPSGPSCHSRTALAMVGTSVCINGLAT